jgi:hypothetical protein
MADDGLLRFTPIDAPLRSIHDYCPRGYLSIQGGIVGRNDQLKYGSAMIQLAAKRIDRGATRYEANRSLNICFPSMIKSLTA